MSRTAVFVATAAALAIAALIFRPGPLSATSPQPPGLVVVEPHGAPLSTASTVHTATTARATTTDGKPVELTARISHPALSSGLSDVYAQLDLTARSAERGPRQPVNLAVVIDRSGSMHGDKLARAKEAALHLIDRLEPEDRLALIHYGGDVAALESMAASAKAKEQMRRFVSDIHDNGDTNIGAGLSRAGEQLRPFVRQFGVSRIILISDGQPTSGLVSPGALSGLVEQLRGEGLTVSAIGVGADFNENLMSAMANVGGGFYGYIDDSERLAEVFGRELDQATSTVARMVELNLEVPEGVSVLNVFGHSVVSGSRQVRLPLYDLAAGQTARVLVRMSARAPEGKGQLQLLTASLRYKDVRSGELHTSQLALGAELAADRSLADARIDKDVAASGVRALGAMMVTQAAQAYQSGRTEEAAGLFDGARRMFGSSADALGGSAVLLDEQKNVVAFEAQLKGSSGAQMNHYVKSVQKKGLRDFGNSNTY